MRQQLEEIKHQNDVLALVIHPQFEAKEHQFLTPPENSFQLGLLKFEKNQVVKPHVHTNTEKTVSSNQEFLYLVSGSVLCSFYWGESIVKTIVLKAGDCLLQMHGGHSFEFLEESKLITIKQGPYFGAAREKEYLHTV